MAEFLIAIAGSHCPVVPGELTLQQLVDEHVLVGSQRCFLVTSGQETVGLITLHRIKEVPRREWGSTNVAGITVPLEQLKRTGSETELWTALQQMDRDGVNQLPVMQNGQVIGMLSREDVITFLRTLQELGM
jgi:signal-transduction protein with cAMP-binding, CBS, and nucleotidyltransferase domain